MKVHEKYIKRCIEIAKNGLPAAMPNPSVGAVIVHNDLIIGEGYTSAFGGNHAEVNAINSVKDKSLLAQSTIYVSLEPCSHFGKTPPCCNLIIENNIPNVVISITDSNEKVAGNGIKKLLEAGVNVVVGVLENECYQSNIRFFTFYEKKRPYIILKWAETQNGFIAPKIRNEQKPVWITNEYSRQLVHKWRSEEQAILVGTQTVIDDNPMLNVRDWTGKNPIRIVLDLNNRIPQESNIYDKSQETFVITNDDIFDNNNLAQETANFCYNKNIQSIIIEGGSRTLQTFIDANIWDEARVFRSDNYFDHGIKAPILEAKVFEKFLIDGDEFLIYRNY